MKLQEVELKITVTIGAQDYSTLNISRLTSLCANEVGVLAVLGDKATIVPWVQVIRAAPVDVAKAVAWFTGEDEAGKPEVATPKTSPKPAVAAPEIKAEKMSPNELEQAKKDIIKALAKKGVNVKAVEDKVPSDKPKRKSPGRPRKAI